MLPSPTHVFQVEENIVVQVECQGVVVDQGGFLRGHVERHQLGPGRCRVLSKIVGLALVKLDRIALKIESENFICKFFDFETARRGCLVT